MATTESPATTAPVIRAPRGTELRCKGWQQEAALRCLMNNLDPENAERPQDLVVYGGIGKAARNWECYHAIVRELERLGAEDTLLVQSGKPVAVFPTHEMAPRVIIANSNLVGKWANWEHFNELDRKGLMMYGQMTAGSWIYIGTQGILQGTFQTFAALADQHFGGTSRTSRTSGAGTLKGKLVVTGGMGGMGGAQPLSVTLNGGVALVVEIDRSRIERRVQNRYCDCLSESLDEALVLCEEACLEGRALSVGLVGNCADVLPEIVRRGVHVDVVTDQTSAHDPLNGYVPQGLSLSQAAELRQRDPGDYVRRSTASMVVHVDAMLALQRAGAVTFDYGNNIRRFAFDAGCADAFNIPGFVPEYIRPLFCTGTGPFRWVALSGDSRDIDRTDELALELFPENEILTRWLKLARGRFDFQGLPARICWLGFGERAKMGLAINDLVRKGELKAPIAMGRDHLDAGSVASPYRETEKMLDGSDAVADWPILNALLNTASGATWVSFHHGGGVGMGYSLHAGQVTVADGTEMAARKIARVLNNDPGLGVVRHADAGYELAQRTAREKGIQMPMAARQPEGIAVTEKSSNVTVEELFARGGLLPRGPAKWKTEDISEYCAGIYVVALTNEFDRCPFSEDTVAELGLDEDRLNEERGHWLPGQVVLYIGQTTKQTLAHRIHQFYIHKYGNRSPHRGGQAVHLLKCDRWVYWAPTSDPKGVERRMVDAFKERVGYLPFGNRQNPRNRSRN